MAIIQPDVDSPAFHALCEALGKVMPSMSEQQLNAATAAPLDVEFSLNGVDLDFNVVMKIYQESYLYHVNRAAIELVKSKLSLLELLNKIDRMSYEIDEALGKAFGMSSREVQEIREG